MAKVAADRTESGATAVTATTVNFLTKEKDAAGKWEVVAAKTVVLAIDEVPDLVKANNGDLISLKGYGIRALLLDRSSEFRKLGLAAYYGQAQDLFNDMLKQGLFELPSTGKAAALDPWLIEAVAALQACSVAQATAALKAIPAEDRAVLAGKPAVAAKILELQEAAKGTTVDLGGLLNL